MRIRTKAWLFALASAFVSIVEPIAALHASTEAIGRGDLDHQAGLAVDDELGDLSRALDQMTSNLKRITASRDELDTEVQMRRQAESRLHETLAELERSNKELEQFAYVASHDLGVSSYIQKPVTFAKLVNVVEILERYWFEIVKLPPNRD